MNSDSPLRVAVIGYGLAGAVFHAPLIEATPTMHVAGIVTSNPQRREAAAAAYPRAAILSSVADVWQNRERFDLAVVATPNRTHVPLALQAIDLGLPVVVDKPLAPSATAARTLIEASESRGVALTVFQNRRWDGDFRTVLALMDGDLLGPVARFESRFERYRPAPRAGAWRELPDPEEGGGLLLDLGSHLIDQALVLFGRPLEVYAEMAARRAGAQVDDDTFVALRFGEVQAHLWMNVVLRIPGPRFHLGGLRGSYRKYGLDPQEDALKEGMRPGDPGWGAEPKEAWGTLSTETAGLHLDGAVETLPGRYEVFYSQLGEALLTGAPLPVDPRDALSVLHVIEAARISAEQHRIVTLDADGQPQ